MAVYSDFIVTNRGRIQYAKAISGTKLTFTQIKLGTGTPTIPQKEMNDVVSLSMSANISSIDTTTQEGVARLTIEISNENIHTAIGIREIGVFCKNEIDNTEVMYAYAYSETDIDVIPSSSYGVVTWKMTISLAITNADAETGTGANIFSSFTPTVTVTPAVGGTIFADIVARECKYSNINGLVTAFYNLTGTLYTMENYQEGITAFKISLPQTASLNAPILCNLIVDDTIVEVSAKVDAANDVIDIQYFGTINGAFELTAVAQYLS